MIAWNILDSTSQLESIVEDSYNAPQFIFKHSTTCSISAVAKRRLESAWDSNMKPYFLDLHSFRSLSNKVADLLNVHHESPQLIIIKDGKAVYSESHLDISANAVIEYI